MWSEADLKRASCYSLFIFALAIGVFTGEPALTSTAASTVQSGSASITSIDVDDLLAKALNINRALRPEENDACRQSSPGAGMRARLYCVYQMSFRDLKVDEITNIQVGRIDLSKFPFSFNYKQLYYENCWDRDYPFDETAKYESRQVATVSFNQVLTHIRDTKETVGFSATLFKNIGIKTSQSIGDQVTFSVTKGSTSSLEDNFTLTSRMKFPIPARTASSIYYSDEKRDVRIPIIITGVIAGRVVDHVIGRGWIAGAEWDRPLYDLSIKPKALRTFTIHGVVEFLGSDRVLHIKTREHKLTTEYCAKPPSENISNGR
jgi:hypothetical protein